MNIKSLEQQISKRAEDRVQKKISACKAAVMTAIAELYGEPHNKPRMTRNERTPERYAKVLRVLSEKHWEGWPKELWEAERSAVTAEVMNTMNELQRVLLAKDVEAENISEEPTQAGDETAG